MKSFLIITIFSLAALVGLSGCADKDKGFKSITFKDKSPDKKTKFSFIADVKKDEVIEEVIVKISGVQPAKLDDRDEKLELSMQIMALSEDATVVLSQTDPETFVLVKDTGTNEFKALDLTNSKMKETLVTSADIKKAIGSEDLSKVQLQIRIINDQPEVSTQSTDVTATPTSEPNVSDADGVSVSSTDLLEVMADELENIGSEARSDILAQFSINLSQLKDTVIPIIFNQTDGAALADVDLHSTNQKELNGLIVTSELVKKKRLNVKSGILAQGRLGCVSKANGSSEMYFVDSEKLKVPGDEIDITTFKNGDKDFEIREHQIGKDKTESFKVMNSGLNSARTLIVKEEKCGKGEAGYKMFNYGAIEKFNMDREFSMQIKIDDGSNMACCRLAEANK